MIIGISGKIGSGKDTVGQIIQYLTHPGKYLSFQSFRELSRAENSGWEIKKFAGKLKQICSLMLGIPVEDFEKQEVKDRVLGPEWSQLLFKIRDTGKFDKISTSIEDLESFKRRFKHIGDVEDRPMTVRQFLQEFGTNAVRDVVHKNAWVNALFADYKEELGGYGMSDHDLTLSYPNWIITDCRFPNEAKAIEEHGGLLIRIERPSKVLINPGHEDLLSAAGKEAYKTWTAPHPSETALDSYPFKEVIINDGSLEELVEKVRLLMIKHKIL